MLLFVILSDDRSIRDSERKAALMHFNTDQVIKVGKKILWAIPANWLEFKVIPFIEIIRHIVKIMLLYHKKRGLNYTMCPRKSRPRQIMYPPIKTFKGGFIQMIQMPQS